MWYDHSMHLEARVPPGTTVQQVADALKPIADYFGYRNFEATLSNGTTVLDMNKFLFNQGTGALRISTYGKVRSNYIDSVQEAARRLGRIVAEPGEIRLYDHETDIDDAKTVIEFGPSDEAIRAYTAKRDIEAALKMMEPHLLDDELEAVRRIIAASKVMREHVVL